jgi:hypothetical protein
MASMKNLVPFVLFTGATLAASQAFAFNFLQVSGAICQEEKLGATASCVEYRKDGVLNACTHPISVRCPITTLQSTNTQKVTRVSFSGIDVDTQYDLSCYVQNIAWNGSVLYSSGNLSTYGNSYYAQSQTVYPYVEMRGFWQLACSIPRSYSRLISIEMEWTTN